MTRDIQQMFFGKPYPAHMYGQQVQGYSQEAARAQHILMSQGEAGLRAYREHLKRMASGPAAWQPFPMPPDLSRLPIPMMQQQQHPLQPPFQPPTTQAPGANAGSPQQPGPAPEGQGGAATTAAVGAAAALPNGELSGAPPAAAPVAPAAGAEAMVGGDAAAAAAAGPAAPAARSPTEPVPGPMPSTTPPPGPLLALLAGPAGSTVAPSSGPPSRPGSVAPPLLPPFLPFGGMMPPPQAFAAVMEAARQGGPGVGSRLGMLPPPAPPPAMGIDPSFRSAALAPRKPINYVQPQRSDKAEPYYPPPVRFWSSRTQPLHPRHEMNTHTLPMQLKIPAPDKVRIHDSKLQDWMLRNGLSDVAHFFHAHKWDFKTLPWVTYDDLRWVREQCGRAFVSSTPGG